MPSERLPPSMSMATLADFTRSNLILPRLRGNDAASVIRELAEALEQGGDIRNALEFSQAALDRERKASTEMTAGMAFPHARFTGVNQIRFALGRSEQPLRWGLEGSSSVRLVFLLAIPIDDTLQSLRLISGLARLSKESPTLTHLMEATDAIRMLDILGSVGLRSPAVTDAA